MCGWRYAYDVTQHTFGTDIKDLNDTFGIGGNTRELFAVENGAL